jgi:hypothetical protein
MRTRLLTLLALTWASLARAGTCAGMEGANPALADIDAAVRLAYLHDEARDARGRARMWSRGWGLGFLGGGLGQAGLVPLTKNPADQRVYALGAVSSLIGATAVWVAPPTAPRHLRELDALTAEGSLDECALLARAEQMLVKDAAGQRAGDNWWSHGRNLALNAAGGLLLGLGWDQWDDAFLGIAVGTLVGEVMIWTQPMDRERTREMYLRATWTDGVRAQLQVVPRLSAEEVGLALVGRW